jgi:hypothetical protein
MPLSILKVNRGRAMSQTKRWYDSVPELRGLIERLRDLGKDKRDALFDGIKKLDPDFDTKFIDRHVLEFPMHLKRRWYDQDPYSWLVINALKYADGPLLDRVIDFLKKKLPA